MTSLRTRVDALEAGSGGMPRLLISWLPSDCKSESATVAGKTYAQSIDESREQFRDRLGRALVESRQGFAFIQETSP